MYLGPREAVAGADGEHDVHKLVEVQIPLLLAGVLVLGLLHRLLDRRGGEGVAQVGDDALQLLHVDAVAAILVIDLELLAVGLDLRFADSPGPDKRFGELQPQYGGLLVLFELGIAGDLLANPLCRAPGLRPVEAPQEGCDPVGRHLVGVVHLCPCKQRLQVLQLSVGEPLRMSVDREEVQHLVEAQRFGAISIDELHSLPHHGSQGREANRNHELPQLAHGEPAVAILVKGVEDLLELVMLVLRQLLVEGHKLVVSHPGVSGDLDRNVLDGRLIGHHVTQVLHDGPEVFYFDLFGVDYGETFKR
mmetsp:Transcript_41196/g.119079  ORF Transcript_41196/g.119079 Transcript_41196/m.119079 type:complete len:305 (-) Transcript_41196:793-1707(-)